MIVGNKKSQDKPPRYHFDYTFNFEYTPPKRVRWDKKEFRFRELD